MSLTAWRRDRLEEAARRGEVIKLTGPRSLATPGPDVTPPQCPECRDGKCRNCIGEALNDADELVPCGCAHHADGGTT